MTQPLTWLITAPAGESFSRLLTVACRGNDKIASLLNALLYEGALVANRTGLKPKETEFVRMNLNLDKIAGGLQRLQRSASKPTIIEWRKKLEQWGFLKFDGHRQIYDLYFHRIEEAIHLRPPKETTPRGRHAKKKAATQKRDLSVESTVSTLDNSTYSSVDKGDLSLEERDLSVDYTNEIQAWRGEKSELKSHILKLEAEISELKSLISSERACRAGLEAKVDTLYNLVNNLADKSLNEENEGPSTPSPPDGNSFNQSLENLLETSHENAQPSSPDPVGKDYAPGTPIHIADPASLQSESPNAIAVPTASQPGTVIQNSTRKLSRAEQISAWVDQLGILSDKERKAAYIATLAACPRIDSIEALTSLRDYAVDDLYRRKKKRKVFLGNLVVCLEDWVDSLDAPGETEAALYGYVASDIGMTPGELDGVVRELDEYCPDFHMGSEGSNGRWFVGIFTDTAIIELGAPDDWQRVPGMLKSLAVQHGREYWAQQQSTPPLAVVGM